MTQTVYGIACDRDGLASREVLRQGPLRPELARDAWATPSRELRPIQPSRIPINYAHDPGEVLGDVVHIERGPGDNVWLVGEIRDDFIPAVAVKVAGETRTVETPMYWSLERSSTWDNTDIEILGVALTPGSARPGARPVEFLDGGLNYRGASKRWRLSGYTGELLQRACDSQHLRRRDRQAPLRVHEALAYPERDRPYRDGPADWATLEDQHWRRRDDARPPGKLRMRPCVITDVR